MAHRGIYAPIDPSPYHPNREVMTAIEAPARYSWLRPTPQTRSILTAAHRLTPLVVFARLATLLFVWVVAFAAHRYGSIPGVFPTASFFVAPLHAASLT